MKIAPKMPNNPRETENREKSYAAWLSEKGISLSPADGEYRADAERAEENYAKGLSTYGKNAESLAESGLSSSGYADYLNAAASAKRKAALGSAAWRLAKRKADLKSGYEAYLSDYRERQEKTADALKRQLIEDGVTDADYAYQVALAAGLMADRARAVASYGTDVAREKRKEEATKYAIEHEMNSTEAYRYALGAGLTDAAASRVAAAAEAYEEEHKNKANFLAEMTPAEYLEYLQSLDKIIQSTFEK